MAADPGTVAIAWLARLPRARSFDHGTSLRCSEGRLAATCPQGFAARGFARRFEDGATLPLADVALRAVDVVCPNSVTLADSPPIATTRT
jgi:hypothetical protein